MPKKKKKKFSVRFQGKSFNITVIQVYAPTNNTKESEVEWFYDDLQDLLDWKQKQKKSPFHHWGLECKSRKSRNTCHKKQVRPWSVHTTPTTLSCQLHCQVHQHNEEKPENVISSQSWACSGRFCHIGKCPLQSFFPWNSSAFSLREVNTKAWTQVTQLWRSTGTIWQTTRWAERKWPLVLWSALAPGDWGPARAGPLVMPKWAPPQPEPMWPLWWLQGRG